MSPELEIPLHQGADPRRSSCEGETQAEQQRVDRSAWHLALAMCSVGVDAPDADLENCHHQITEGP